MSAGSCANVHSLGLPDCAENLTRDEMRNLDRDLTPGEDEELSLRNIISGMTDATLNSTAKPDPPICLAIIGPGGVGKSATTKGLRTDLNLSHGVYCSTATSTARFMRATRLLLLRGWHHRRLAFTQRFLGSSGNN